MITKKHIVDDNLIELEIEGHKGFMYRPITGGDDLLWLDEYMEIDATGKTTASFGKLNRCKLLNLAKVPVEEGLIKEILKGNKDSWEKLNKDERWEFLSKVNPDLLNKILSAIEKLNKNNDPKKKD